MKQPLLVLAILLGQTSGQALSLPNERCWSAAPILKSADQSKKLEIEQKLCSMDFYQGEYSVCPKLNSTNPGVLVVRRLVNMSDVDFKKAYCSDMDEAKELGKAKVDAKFKQTISCSDTSSSVAYYRISEFLSANHVSVAVFRTMDEGKHLELTSVANSYLAGKSDLIAQNWKYFAYAHGVPQKFPSIFLNNMVYGALIENIKSEFQYNEVSGIGPYESRYERFLQQKPFIMTSSPQSITALAGGKDFKTLAPVVTQMKDVSNMIVLDHMLNQADRIGNIHFKYKWLKLEDGKISDSSSEAKPASRIRDIIPAGEQLRANSGEVLVRNMVLKDNDCGISKDNEMKKIGALQKVKHLSPKVYRQVQKLADFVSTTEGADYFKNELRINDKYFYGTEHIFGIKNNILEVAQILRENCKNGLLALDLNLEKLLMDSNYKASCDAD